MSNPRTVWFCAACRTVSDVVHVSGCITCRYPGLLLIDKDSISRDSAGRIIDVQAATTRYK